MNTMVQLSAPYINPEHQNTQSQTETDRQTDRQTDSIQLPAFMQQPTRTFE